MAERVIPERLAALDTITLHKSSHLTFAEGHCAMEVVAWLAGEDHTDVPDCASPVLRTFMIELNDQWGDEQRQKLRPYLPGMVGTAGDGQDEARAYLALDWLIRVFTPAWLELAGLSVEAQACVICAGLLILYPRRRLAWWFAMRGRRQTPLRPPLGSPVGPPVGPPVGSPLRTPVGPPLGMPLWSPLGPPR